MEHYKSVFATTALMVFGLVAASPMLRAEDPALVKPAASRAVTDSASDDAWSDPPRSAPHAPSSDPAAAPAKVEVPSVVKPASFSLLSPETAALFAASDLTRVDQALRVHVVRRHRAAKVASRQRAVGPAEIASDPAAQPAPENRANPPQKDARIDPIGDLLRGLGIGRNS